MPQGHCTCLLRGRLVRRRGLGGGRWNRAIRWDRVAWNRVSDWGSGGSIGVGGQGRAPGSWYLSWRPQTSIKLMDPSLFLINIQSKCFYFMPSHGFGLLFLNIWSFLLGQGFFVNSSILIWCLKGRLVRFIFIWNSSLFPFFFSVCLCQLHQQTGLENMLILGAWDFNLGVYGFLPGEKESRHSEKGALFSLSVSPGRLAQW